MSQTLSLPYPNTIEGCGGVFEELSSKPNGLAWTSSLSQTKATARASQGGGGPSRTSPIMHSGETLTYIATPSKWASHLIAAVCMVASASTGRRNRQGWARPSACFICVF